MAEQMMQRIVLEGRTPGFAAQAKAWVRKSGIPCRPEVDGRFVILTLESTKASEVAAMLREQHPAVLPDLFQAALPPPTPGGISEQLTGEGYWREREAVENLPGRKVRLSAWPHEIVGARRQTYSDIQEDLSY